MKHTQVELIHANQHMFHNVDLGGVCFISDLHLSSQMPVTLAQFEHFCESIALEYDTLIVLGDLFEYWLGDDTIQDNPAALRVTEMLSQLHSLGKKIGFIAGNRDFLIRQEFAQQMHATLLPDPCVIQINQQKVLLSHGDLLCTDDTHYQRFRRIAQQTWLQNLFLKMPLSWRIRLAQNLRQKSQHHWQDANETQRKYLIDIQDVNPNAATEWFEQFETHVIIHGHTHRPSTHLTHNTTRLVLPDWDCDDTQHLRWGYLSWSKEHTEPKLHYFTTPSN